MKFSRNVGSFMWTEQGEGGGFLKKTCLSTSGEGGVRGLSTWTKMFYGYPFCAHEFWCHCLNSYMMSFWNRYVTTHDENLC